jgi:hypothetical protein
MRGNASAPRRVHVLCIASLAALAVLIALALAAKPAQAAPVQVTGFETRLEVNVSNFVKILSAGIFPTAIPPARLEYGSQPAAIFPVTPGGAVDVPNALVAVSHGGGLRLAKDSIGVTLDTTNLTVECTSQTTCRLLGTASMAVPTEVAEIHDVTITDDEEGTITFTGRALVGQATALVLNTLFETDVFFAGMELGVLRGQWTYAVQTQADAYPRPKGATPLRVSLVPAYNQCQTPDREHGPPLDSPSCAAPVPSSILTVGTFDANGAAANSVASALYSVIPGNPATPAVDEADVRITVDATDVRWASDLTDYEGELQAVASVRVTDRNNSILPPIFPDDQNGTMQDVPFAVTVPCTLTPDAAIGGHCAVATTADAVVPGTVTERDRAIWAFDQVTLLDGGEDGDVDTADNSVFATQGVFVP